MDVRNSRRSLRPANDHFDAVRTRWLGTPMSGERGVFIQDARRLHPTALRRPRAHRGKGCDAHRMRLPRTSGITGKATLALASRRRGFAMGLAAVARLLAGRGSGRRQLYVMLRRCFVDMLVGRSSTLPSPPHHNRPDRRSANGVSLHPSPPTRRPPTLPAALRPPLTACTPGCAPPTTGRSSTPGSR